jgi:hypothetical protein
MKIYFIGGTSSFSSKIVNSLKDDFSHEVVAVGKRTGHVIPQDTEKIINESLTYDSIINFTYANGSQLDFTLNLYKSIIEKNWDGYFINFGSSIVLHGKGSVDNTIPAWQKINYISRKKSVQEAGYQISRNFFNNGFRYTQIQCGMLANEKMKNLPSYRETCLQAEDLSNVINYLLHTKSNLHIHELIIDGK